MGRREVEDFRRLSIFWLNQNSFIPKYRGLHRGSIVWYWGEERSGNINFEVEILSYEEKSAVGTIRLYYKYRDGWSEEWTDLDYKVILVTTPCRYGGFRFWFECPLVKNGVYCGRRVGVLHGFSEYFGCRHCGDLVYADQNLGGPWRGGVTDDELYKAEMALKRQFYRGKPTKNYLRLLKMRRKNEESWQKIARHISLR